MSLLLLLVVVVLAVLLNSTKATATCPTVLRCYLSPSLSCSCSCNPYLPSPSSNLPHYPHYLLLPAPFRPFLIPLHAVSAILMCL